MSLNVEKNVQLQTTQRHSAPPTATSVSNTSNVPQHLFRGLRKFVKNCVRRVMVVFRNGQHHGFQSQEDEVYVSPQAGSRAARSGASSIVGGAVRTGTVGHADPGTANGAYMLSTFSGIPQSVASVTAHRGSPLTGSSRAANFVPARTSIPESDTPLRAPSDGSPASCGSPVSGSVLDVGPKLSFNMSRISPWYVVQRMIGQGGQSTVYAAEDEQRETVALKCLRKAAYDGGAGDILLREARVQSILLHRNVLKVFGMFDDEDHVYAVMEYAPGGDLMDEIYKGRSNMDETRAAIYTRQIAGALRCCHSAGVVHRDVKPENIVIGVDGSAKLADFGWCLSPDSGGRSRLRECGTPEFRAPEMNGRNLYGTEVDMWALGLVIVEMLYRRRPSEVLRGPWWARRVKLPDDSSVGSDAQDLIRGLLRRKASKRLTAEEVLQQRWVVRNAGG